MGALITNAAMGQTGSALECPKHRHLMHLLLCAQNCAEATEED